MTHLQHEYLTAFTYGEANPFRIPLKISVNTGFSLTKIKLEPLKDL